MALVINSNFASPLANAEYPKALEATAEGFVARVCNGITGLNLAVTVLLLLIAYDQC